MFASGDASLISFSVTYTAMVYKVLFAEAYFFCSPILLSLTIYCWVHAAANVGGNYELSAVILR